MPGPAGAAIAAYIAGAGGGATASFTAGTRADNPGAPDMAVFSSRGPNGAVSDIIKPDVTAPGVQILAGNSPTPFIGAPGQLFQAIQGTSMSSPHVAGVGALLVGEHPDWTPAMIRSALTTTGDQGVDKEDGTTPADPFDMGGGHIQPMPANDPGLVYDADFDDYVAFLCGAGQLVVPARGQCRPERPQPGDDRDRSTRRNPDGDPYRDERRCRWYLHGTVEAPAGVDVVVSPSTFTIAAGASATYTVTFTTTDAVVDQWAFGSLTWNGGGHSVRSPIAVRPVALAAPEEVSGEGTSGTTSYKVTFGYTGPFETATHGLVPATVESRSVVDDPANDINVALGTGVGIDVVAITVPAGTRHLRASLFDEATDGEDDLDLYLFDPDGNFVDGSGSATSAEQVDAAVARRGRLDAGRPRVGDGWPRRRSTTSSPGSWVMPTPAT